MAHATKTRPKPAPAAPTNGIRFLDARGKDTGPITLEAFAQLFNRKDVTEETLIYNDALQDWVPLKSQEVIYTKVFTMLHPNHVEVFVDLEAERMLAKAGVKRDQIAAFVRDGGRIVRFRYAISIILVSFLRSTGECVIRPGESAWQKSLPYTLVSLLLGLWGFPFGPIMTIQALLINLTGGENLTPAYFAEEGSKAALEAEATRIRNLWFLSIGLFVGPPLVLLGILLLLR